jgi:hypothetical protein
VLCLILTSLLLFCLSCQAIANRRATLVCKACPQRLNPSRLIPALCPLLFSDRCLFVFAARCSYVLSLHHFFCFVFLSQPSRTQELRYSASPAHKSSTRQGLSPPTACLSFLINALLSLLLATLMSFPDISSFVLSFLLSHLKHKSYATLQALPKKAQPVEVCHRPLPACLF